MVAVFGVTNAFAKWEKVYDLTATYACHVTKSGNILLSDYQYMDYSGGIYISEDQGASGLKPMFRIFVTANLLKLKAMCLPEVKVVL